MSTDSRNGITWLDLAKSWADKARALESKSSGTRRRAPCSHFVEQVTDEIVLQCEVVVAWEKALDAAWDAYDETGVEGGTSQYWHQALTQKGFAIQKLVSITQEWSELSAVCAQGAEVK